MPAAIEPRLRGWLAHWPAAVLGLLAALVALWARHHLFPALSWNRDEPVYLWHVDVLRAGQLTATDGGHPSLFHPWLSARGDGVFFTQYTLGWPLVLLAAAVSTGSAANALLLGASLAVVGTYTLGLELLRDRRVALLGAGLMVASPILAIQGGVYLSYLFTLGLGLLFGTLLLRGIRLQRWGPVAVAGVLLGWIFLTRPYDAVLWGGAFGAYVLIRERHRWRPVATALVVTGTGALPLVVGALLYNRHVTGGFLEFPITATDPLDTFGFGRKRLMPTFEVVDYGLYEAVRATAKNAFVLPWFLAGTYVGLVAAAVGAWQRRRDPALLALVLVGAVFPIGYFVFWGTHLSSLASRISGPIYFIPLYAPICLLIASAVMTWWGQRRTWALGLVVALVVATVPAAISRFDVNRDISVRQEPWGTSVESIDGPAIVFVADSAPYLLFANPFSSNGPHLDDRVLYAADGTPAMLDLIAEMPGRTPYLQQATIAAQDLGPREDPYDLDVLLTPVEVRRGPRLSLSWSIAPPPDVEFTHVTISTGAATHTYTHTQPPNLRCDGAVRAQNQRKFEGVDGCALPLMAPGAVGPGLHLLDRGTLTVTVGFGRTATDAARTPAVRQSLVYRVVDGQLEVLLPSAKHRYEEIARNDFQWRRTAALAELQIDVRPG